MSQRSQLVKKLRQFTENFRAIKKLSPTNEPSERQQYQNILSTNRQLIEIIQLYFKEIYNSHQNDVATDKLRKQFINLLSNYEQHLKIYQQHEDRQVRQLRKTYTQLRSSIIERQRKRSSVAESDKYGMEIQMVEINQQTLHYERMIQIKEKEIKTIKDRMQGALEVQQVLKTLVDEQGQMLDQAEVNINQAHDNVKEAHQNLIEGQKQHMSSKKKQCCIFTIILVILLAIIVPLIIKFA